MLVHPLFNNEAISIYNHGRLNPVRLVIFNLLTFIFSIYYSMLTYQENCEFTYS